MTLILDQETDEMVCDHSEAYVEEACCPPGTTDCACFGRDQLVCPDPDCTGITNQEAERLWEDID